MPIHEFLCPCGAIKEEIVPSGTKEIRCKCGKTAVKIMSSSTFKINGYSYANGYAKKGKGK